MKIKMLADPVQENLSWRGEFAYLRKRQADGREKWQSLGKLAKDDARRIVKHLVQKFNADALQEQLGMISKRSSYAKLGDVLKAYDLYVAGVDMDVDTAPNNKRALKRIVALVYGDNFDFDGADAGILSKDLLTDYSAAMIAKRKAKSVKLKWDPETLQVQLQRAQRTIGSTVQQARSIFSAAALESRPYKELELPDLSSFMGTRVGESTIVRYSPPALQVLERISADAAVLKLEDPAAWLAMMLEVNGGCRRGTAVEAKWVWFVEGLGADKKPIVELDIRLAKGGNSLVRFDWDLYQEMKALRGDLTGYIVPGDDVDARQAAFDRLVTWLRNRGLDDRRLPNHELRKWFGDQKFSLHGATEAQMALGHSSAKLTGKVYAQARSTQSLRVI